MGVIDQIDQFAVNDGPNNSAARRLIIGIVILLVLCLLFLLIIFLLAAGVIPSASNDTRQSSITMDESDFGTTSDGQKVTKYSMKNKNGMEVDVISLGGYITAIRVPDKNGEVKDVTLGYDTLKEYEEDKPYFGALIGRFGNRIKGGQFEIDGVRYQVTVNNPDPPVNSLHGGVRGWNRAVWKATAHADYVSMTHESPDGDEGFPGKVIATVTFRLTDDNELVMNFTATTDKATPINLTTHPYFNLAGQGTGTIYGQKVTIMADNFTPVTDDLIPTGNISSVEGTDFDLRGGREMTASFLDSLTLMGGGYDNNLCINGPTGKRLAARVIDESSGRILEVFSNQPGVQFYTGNFLNDDKGKGGATYVKHGAMCFEPQNYPDAPNHANFPDSILRPGSEYHNLVIYKFSVQS